MVIFSNNRYEMASAVLLGKCYICFSKCFWKDVRMSTSFYFRRITARPYTRRFITYTLIRCKIILGFKPFMLYRPAPIMAYNAFLDVLILSWTTFSVQSALCLSLIIRSYLKRRELLIRIPLKWWTVSHFALWFEVLMIWSTISTI